MSSTVHYSAQDNTALLTLAAIGLALLTILSVWKLKQFKCGLITETGGAMFYGMLLGLTVRFLSLDRGSHSVESTDGVCTCHMFNVTPHVLMVNISSQGHCYKHVGKLHQRCSPISTPHMETFDPEVFFNLFLPPIIFHGAYTLNQRRFIENMGSVMTFAFLGTVISCVTIGACVYGFTRLMVLLGQAANTDFQLTDCFLFGAIMSATDPVSVLGLLTELRMDVDLHTLLFGESVLNDAVAIVLTHAITSYSLTGVGHTFDPLAFLRSVGYFLGVLAGSFLLGFIFTVITALLTKFTSLHENPLLETSIFFLLSWSSFLSAEASGLSGVVAVLFCGLSQARYTIHNLSLEARTRTRQLFEVFHFLGEIFIFSYMGYILLMFPHHVFKALFITGAFLSIFISRACNIYPLSFLLNLGRTNKIPRDFQHFMTFAGLRGAVALSLAVKGRSTEVRRTIFTTTLLLVCFTVWVLGSAAGPLLRCLDIRVGVDEDEDPDDDLSFEVATGRPDTTPGLWHRLDYNMEQEDTVPTRRQLTPDEEQLCEIQPDDSDFVPEKTENELTSVVGGDSGSEHQDDLVEGDLGLGTTPALTREP